MELLKAKVCLKKSLKITAFLYNGIDINIITKKLIEKANLAMKQGSKLELVLHTGHSRPFFDFCKDIEVAIRRIKIRYQIFVFETEDYDLILG